MAIFISNKCYTWYMLRTKCSFKRCRRWYVYLPLGYKSLIATE